VNAADYLALAARAEAIQARRLDPRAWMEANLVIRTKERRAMPFHFNAAQDQYWGRALIGHHPQAAAARLHDAHLRALLRRWAAAAEHHLGAGGARPRVGEEALRHRQAVLGAVAGGGEGAARQAPV